MRGERFYLITLLMLVTGVITDGEAFHHQAVQP